VAVPVSLDLDDGIAKPSGRGAPACRSSTAESSMTTIAVLSALFLFAASEVAAQKEPPGVLSKVDHLVYATPELNRGVEELERLLGVRATPGGQHPGLGTRNALIALGPNVYIEIIAPDPDQPAPSAPRRFGIDELKQSRLVTWAAKGTDLEQLRADAVRNGIPLGEVAPGRRRRPDGVELAWRSTSYGTPVADGIVPFFIDWGQSAHPAQSAAKGATLVALRAEHPNAPSVQGMLQRLGLPLTVTPGARPALIAIIDSPRGRVELR
jgi:hypothetical protein